MMNPSKIFISTLLFGAVICLSTGCSSSDEETNKKSSVTRQAPAPKPRPTTKSVEQLLSSLSIDDRIYMEETRAPRREGERVALLRFFDALLKVDTVTLRNMLSFVDQLELEAMIATGLAAHMQDVTLVELMSGTSPEGRNCVLSVFEIGMDYQVQMWYYENTGNGFSFSAAQTPPNLHEKLSGEWVSSYFALKEKQTEIANQPDEETSYALAGEATTSSGTLDTTSPGGPGPQGPQGPRGPMGPGR